jgi:hypothetical protein
MIALLLASTVNAATTLNAVNNRPRRPRSYRDIAVFIVNFQVAMKGNRKIVPRSARAFLRTLRPLVFGFGLLKVIDRLEAAVCLDHGEEHVIRTFTNN